MWDIIVVGGGSTGLPAAIFGAERGRVLLIDQAPVLGGTLWVATGQMSAGCSASAASRTARRRIMTM
jgi:fumarate reductase flavoprotein subunit